MPDPDVLFLDEPTASLDLAARETLLHDLERPGRRASDRRPSSSCPTTSRRSRAASTGSCSCADGLVAAAGPIADVLRADILSAAFGLDLDVAAVDGRWSARGRAEREPTACRHANVMVDGDHGPDDHHDPRPARRPPRRPRPRARATAWRPSSAPSRRSSPSACPSSSPAFLPGATSLVAAVGQVVIDLQPPGAKDLVVALFGTNDKLALEVVVVLVGRGHRRRPGRPRPTLVRRRGRRVRGLRRRRRSWPRWASRWPTRRWSPSRLAIGVGAAIQTLSWGLVRLAAMDAAAATGAPRRRRPIRCVARSCVRTGALGHRGPRRPGSRGAGSSTSGRSAPTGAATPIPPAAEMAAPAAPGRRPRPDRRPGLTPIVVPNDAFYRIDTALLTPSVDAATWTLRIHGMVDREVEPDLGPARGHAHGRAVRDHRLRQQRGRRRARRQRQVDRRAAARRPRPGRRPGRREPARRPLGRWLDGGHADGVGHGRGPRAAHRREDERRAPAAGSTATRPGSSSPGCTATCRRRSG